MWQWLSTFQTNFVNFKTPTCKLAQYLAPILEPLATNKYTVKDLFQFGIEIVEQDFSNFLGSLDIDSVFANIALEETIMICTKNIFKHNGIVRGLKNSEFKYILSLATKEQYFIFNNISYKLTEQLQGLHQGLHYLMHFWLITNKIVQTVALWKIDHSIIDGI